MKERKIEHWTTSIGTLLQGRIMIELGVETRWNELEELLEQGWEVVYFRLPI